MTGAWGPARVARLVALAIVIGWSVANAIQRIGDWSLSDMDAYSSAAMRLREGLPLYPVASDAGAADVFRYAPWFAWAWVPLTYVPRAAVAFGWSALLVAATAVAIWPLVVRRTLPAIGAAALFGSILLWCAASGNVHPLLVAVLVLGVDRHSGPVWIGIASSLKIFPLGFALVYAGRREWSRAIVAACVAALLWLPALAYGLSEYQTSFLDSPNPLLLVNAVAYGVVVVVVALATVALARTRFGWLLAAVTVVSAIPRLSLIELSYLVVGAPSRHSHRTMGLGDIAARRATVPHDLAGKSLPQPEER
jgi:hypothetical protein